MRRPALAAAVVALAASVPAHGASTPPPDRVMASGAEFSLVLSKQKVTPGRVIVQFLNAGQDPHDLRIQRVGDSAQLGGTGVLQPGTFQNLDLRLKASSRYVLWCSLNGHRGLGMEATLRTGAGQQAPPPPPNPTITGGRTKDLDS